MQIVGGNIEIIDNLGITMVFDLIEQSNETLLNWGRRIVTNIFLGYNLVGRDIRIIITLKRMLRIFRKLSAKESTLILVLYLLELVHLLEKVVHYLRCMKQWHYRAILIQSFIIIDMVSLLA